MSKELINIPFTWIVIFSMLWPNNVEKNKTDINK